MKIYHGGTDCIQLPILLDSQRLLDFGKGFYTTTNLEQAKKWAVIKRNRLGADAEAIVNVYDFDEEILQNPVYKIKIFEKATEDWLDFVVSNRQSNDSHPYNIVMGPVANDTLYQTLSLFETGILTKPETISRLKTHLLFDQISFHNTVVLGRLKFIESFVVFSN